MILNAFTYHVLRKKIFEHLKRDIDLTQLDMIREEVLRIDAQYTAIEYPHVMGSDQILPEPILHSMTEFGEHSHSLAQTLNQILGVDPAKEKPIDVEKQTLSVTKRVIPDGAILLYIKTR